LKSHVQEGTLVETLGDSLRMVQPLPRGAKTEKSRREAGGRRQHDERREEENCGGYY
jgi:hypothetical protein